MKQFRKNFGDDSSPSDKEPVAWIEKDGQEGPTIPEEYVTINDKIEDGVVIHVKCNNW